MSLYTLAALAALLPVIFGAPQAPQDHQGPQVTMVAQGSRVPTERHVKAWTPNPEILHTVGTIGVPNKATNGFTIENTLAAGPWATVIGSYKPTTNFLVKDSIIEGQWYVNTNSGVWGNWTKWGIRLYDVSGFLATNTVFRNIGNEHGAYLNVVGDVTFERCQFYNIGSQGVQFVYRPHESSNPAWRSNPGLIRLSRCIFQQCTGPGGPGWPAARSSFTISSHPRDPGHIHPGQNLSVQDVYMEAEFEPFLSSGKGAQSFGAIMCEWHDTLRINRVRIDYTKPNTRPVIQAHHLNRMFMKDVYVKEGKIDIRGVPFVRIDRCFGNAQIWDTLSGIPTFIGPISGGYTKG